MRKRCFIIAGLAFALGIILNLVSVPSSEDVKFYREMNKSTRKLQEAVDAGPFSEGRRTDIYQNSLGPDPILMGASLGSFALAGVMLLVGFIAGPKKRETPT